MDASVLVVGGNQFVATFFRRLRNLVSGRIESASHLDDVIPLIQTQQPSILILQASFADSLELCRQIKEQPQLVAIYCIVVEIVPQLNENESWDRNWELLEAAQAMENGADAYLQIAAATELGVYSVAEDRLLLAHIRAGVTQVKNYRQLMETNDFLSSIALADALTGLNNRRALEWDLPRQVQNARTRIAPLSLIMLDVDFFKSINDNHGHLVGDRVLKILSARLQHNLRVQDTLFRYGGEEFVVILSNTPPSEAQHVARRLRCLIADQPFSIEESLAINVTISLGTASLKPTDDGKGVSLLNRADQNLLLAKNSGRNQVVSEGSEF
ncbi:diguanylate cyclase [Microcoleus sp. FACHB-831]|uniref:GGDEF domain-containing response regulator n=1 Tax=Microcoleus sp. FACHB-831 TaxID=2692827 RepID=UPI001688DD87|nr:diguanylate cyclase [Microcoleus sp. FACHB-831]MBD1921929.1 diguanylate cyclase [Microcoleus sp. FACHB-831]